MDPEGDMFQDSFDAGTVQMPGDNTIMMMEEFSINTTSDFQPKKTSPGFISAKKLYNENMSRHAKVKSPELNSKDESKKKSAEIELRKEVNPKNSNVLKQMDMKSKENQASAVEQKDSKEHTSKSGKDQLAKSGKDQIVIKIAKSVEVSESARLSSDDASIDLKSKEKILSNKNNKTRVDKQTNDNMIVPNKDRNSPKKKDIVSAKEYLDLNKQDNKISDEKNQDNSDSKSEDIVEDPACDLDKWGLPESILEQYQDKGIRRMFSWQVECLRSDGVMQGGNLVYSAPTSAGKTLVAEILMMKRVIECGRKALLILPFVSLAREKMFHLQHVLSDTGIRVEGFMGSISPAGGIKVTDIAVATIEKANGIVNRLLEEGELHTVCCVVVDELHLLGDPSRGYLLELLLTKIRYVSHGQRDPEKSVQIIGMSATLPNLSDLSRWLNASLYTTNFRPVPLTELVKIGTTLLNTELVPVGSVLPGVKIPSDTDHLSWLSLETVLGGHSILIFCPIKSWVEKLAETLAKDFFYVGKPDLDDNDPVSCSIRSKLQEQLDGFKLSEVLEQLRRCPSGLDATLASTVRFGVGFHHAGLTTDERDILEGNFKAGVIRVLVATSTLSSGVNLPARRVILRCPMTYNGQLMDKLAYKQMVGRAGRKGVDSAGESILICKESEREKVRELVRGETEAVISCLAAGGNRLAASMKRAILEVIVSGAAKTRDEVERYAQCTLLAAQIEREEENSILQCVEFLENNEFIRIQGGEGEDAHRYNATRLGMACLASSLAPDEGLTVFTELAKARKQFVLENELHIIYLIVPIYAAVSWPKLDWMGFLSMWEGLSEDMRRVGHIVGVEERWIVRAMRGTIRSTDPKQRAALAVHQRFYTALALHDLAHEVPLSTVAEKYGATKGMLQSLQQAASTFAGMVTVFCARLGWCNLELLLGQFQDRLEFGVKRELIDLCRLTSVDGSRARLLHDGGVETVAQLAAAEAGDVENILYSAQPFKSKKDGDTIRKAKTVFISGLPPMTEEEVSKIMVEEARNVLKRDLGLQPGAWIQPESTSATNQKEPVKAESTNKAEKASSVTDVTRNSNRSFNSKRKRSGSFGRLNTSKKRRNSDERNSSSLISPVSPHLEYHLNSTKPQTLSDKMIRKSISPQQGINATDSTDEKFKKPRSSYSPNQSTKSSPSIIGNKSIFISPPELQKQHIDETATGLQDLNEKVELDMPQFDMSSILENIFEDEIEIRTEEKKKKKVSWGDEEFNSDEISASPQLKKAEGSFDCEPDLQVDQSASCFLNMEELTLELSESEPDAEKSESRESKEEENLQDIADCIEECEEIVLGENTVEGFEDDIFETSVENKGITVDQDLCQTVGKTTSPGCMSAVEGWETKFDFSVSNMSKEKSPQKQPKETEKEEDSDDLALQSRKLSPDVLSAGSPLSYCHAKRSLKDRKRNAKKSKKSLRSPGDLIMSDSETDRSVLEVEGIEDGTENLNQNSSAFSNCSKSLENSVSIIDICGDRRLFASFVEEFKSVKKYSFAVALERETSTTEERPRRGRSTGESDVDRCRVHSGVLVGVAFTFSRMETYYLSLIVDEENASNLDETLKPPEVDKKITMDEKLDFLRWLSSSEIPSTAISWRRQAALLYSVTGVVMKGVPRDPDVSSWLLAPGTPQFTLNRLTLEHVPQLLDLLSFLGSAPGVGSVSCVASSPNPGRLRAAIESVLVLHLEAKLFSVLEAKGLAEHYIQVEMKVDSVLLGMELSGMGVHTEEYQDTRLLLEQRCKIVEEEAYRLAGRHFAFSSPQDVCRVLYHELKLPVNGDPKLNLKQVRPGRGGIKLSAAKDPLEKLAKTHALPKLILEHRRISGALTKTVNPLLNACVQQKDQIYPRIFTSCITHTATGRVSMHEPNLQNIPKDFQVEVTDDLRDRALGRRSRRRGSGGRNRSITSTHLAKLLQPSVPSTTVSLRNALVPCDGNLYLSADYSQLELRILAHLSQDPLLLETLNLGGDVFRSLSARLNRIDVEDVSDDQRQQAKQIVYGLVYGIGPKTLGDQLQITEDQAEKFMENFKAKYPGVRMFLNKCVASARKSGVVETMSGRKRSIPDITSTNIHRRAAAERQAVNTRVQGSASDLVKTAMVLIEDKLNTNWPKRKPFKIPRCWKKSGAAYGTGPWLVLQLHDELIYEVPGDDVIKMAEIVRDSMENAVSLSVATPVRIKIGDTWGNMNVYTSSASTENKQNK